MRGWVSASHSQPSGETVRLTITTIALLHGSSLTIATSIVVARRLLLLLSIGVVLAVATLVAFL